MIKVYGLKTCDTCRKAMKWLEAEGIAAEFHDIRGDGITAAQVDGWLDAVGADALVNRRSTTWRGLPDAEKAAIEAGHAHALLLDHPTLIKRPVFELSDGVLVGFTEARKSALLAEK
jgi:Spx/MgsR family transcriptional regulator